uniref:DUF985 domain-containing protein n=1 Tax=Fibrocapsa japonica TaxID=94617 RepID=A0A7S2Y1H2_9STRA|mmetsp:Transcript_8357/g.12755  ORF Transcript_8357/g.12755 Transcript_8357/m.12755 type:complete len:177 (+) Transcript_8357:206-736(+)
MMNSTTKEKIIEKYELIPHPEGGYYKESFRSDVKVQVGSSSGDGKIRTASTAIYFLMTPESVSRLHKIKSDEVWHFYLGTSITVVELDEKTGGYKTTIVGPNVLDGEFVQYTVKAGTWFGSFPNTLSVNEDSFSFVGCTVSPGFEFEDFELGSRGRLAEQFPEAIEMIDKLTVGLP